MTKKQRKILMDAHLSEELLGEVDHYLKDVGSALSGTMLEKETYLTMLCNDIADSVTDNSNVTINNIIGELGTPETHADVFLENKTKDTPKMIRKRMTFRKIILIAAIIVVIIVGVVYTSAFILQNKDAPGTYDEVLSVSYEYIGNVDGEIE